MASLSPLFSIFTSRFQDCHRRLSPSPHLHTSPPSLPLPPSLYTAHPPPASVSSLLLLFPFLFLPFFPLPFLSLSSLLFSHYFTLYMNRQILFFLPLPYLWRKEILPLLLCPLSSPLLSLSSLLLHTSHLCIYGAFAPCLWRWASTLYGTRDTLFCIADFGFWGGGG